MSTKEAKEAKEQEKKLKKQEEEEAKRIKKEQKKKEEEEKVSSVRNGVVSGIAFITCASCATAAQRGISINGKAVGVVWGLRGRLWLFFNSEICGNAAKKIKTEKERGGRKTVKEGKRKT